jgi:anti-sigma factor RsiW
MGSYLPPITDEDIQALVDNELSRDQEKIVLEHLKNNSYYRKRYTELEQQRQLLKKWWDVMHEIPDIKG